MGAAVFKEYSPMAKPSTNNAVPKVKISWLTWKVLITSFAPPLKAEETKATAKVANAKQAQREENDKPRFADSRNDRRATPAGLGIGNGSGSRQSAAKPSSTQSSQQSSANSNSNGQRNDWQPAPGRKSHKKNKSSSGGQPRSPRAHGGEPLPANENERKGG